MEFDNHEIPVFIVFPGNFEEQVLAAIVDINQENCSTERERLYNGQPWTDNGTRGQQIVYGLTMRDIKDCVAKAMLLCSGKPLTTEEFLKCWDFSDSNSGGVPTNYLYSMQNQPDYIKTKVETGNWTYADLYKADFSEQDPIAMLQNVTCEIEKMMGIYPNTSIDFNDVI